MINRYKFCLWLVDKLSYQQLTYAEIADMWKNAAANINGTTLSPRTFLRHKNLAEEIFNVNIDCIKSSNTYTINKEDLRNADKWTLSALRLTNLNSMVALRDFIFVEEPPVGSDLLETVTNACRESRLLSFSYKSHYNDPVSISVIPRFIRLYKQRWYLIAQPTDANKLRTFALKRISNLSVGNPQTPTVTISPVEFYTNYFGIIHDESIAPQHITIRAFWPQNDYLKEMPMHPSQSVAKEGPDNKWTDFELFLRPTYDFKQELLWHRDKLAVLAPESFRRDMLDILDRMRRSYESGQPFCKDE